MSAGAGMKAKPAKQVAGQAGAQAADAPDKQARKLFIAQAVAALKDLEMKKQRGLPESALAQRAYDKLLYDFPVGCLSTDVAGRLNLPCCQSSGAHEHIAVHAGRDTGGAASVSGDDQVGAACTPEKARLQLAVFRLPCLSQSLRVPLARDAGRAW